MASSLPERMLVRDCLHCCQGGQGGRFVSWFEREGRYDVVGAGGEDDDSLDKVSVPQRQLIWRITEVGRLVRRLNGVVAGEMCGGGSGGAFRGGGGNLDVVTGVHTELLGGARCDQVGRAQRTSGVLPCYCSAGGAGNSAGSEACVDAASDAGVA